MASSSSPKIISSTINVGYVAAGLHFFSSFDVTHCSPLSRRSTSISSYLTWCSSRNFCTSLQVGQVLSEYSLTFFFCSSICSPWDENHLFNYLLEYVKIESYYNYSRIIRVLIYDTINMEH